MSEPCFLITIDTEGDNLWARKDLGTPGTENAKYLFRFQELCEKYGFIPTYLTNYEMARDKVMCEFGQDGLKRGVLELGAHEHAWNQPPYWPLIRRPGEYGKPYLVEYPTWIIRQKLDYLTKFLEDTFQTSVRSHRGGRWCLNMEIVRELGRLGYFADCTCTPGISWQNNRGWSPFSEGTDWSACKNQAFFLSYQEGTAFRQLLEIPVTIIGGDWLRPTGRNLRNMLRILDRAIADGNPYVEFMLHSSELMPGGSPTFHRAEQVEKLYSDLDALFTYAVGLGFSGEGMGTYAKKLLRKA